MNFKDVMFDRPVLEVCVDTARGLQAACQGGADRIEPGSALALDDLPGSAPLGVRETRAEIGAELITVLVELGWAPPHSPLSGSRPASPDGTPR